MGTLGSIEVEPDGSLSFIVPVTFTRPIINTSIFGNRMGPEGYVVNMNRLPNKCLDNPDRLARHFYDFIYWAKLQEGYGYLLCSELPVRVLNALRILRAANCISGYDIDDDGMISYCEEEDE